MDIGKQAYFDRRNRILQHNRFHNVAEHVQLLTIGKKTVLLLVAERLLEQGEQS